MTKGGRKMIFKTVYEKDGKTLVKLSGLADNDEKGTWANCTSAVFTYAKKTYKDGDEVDAEYSVKNGEYNVTRITKKGQGGGGETKPKSNAPTCADCGKELKDSKYEKCYLCNKKNPSKPSSSGGDGRPDYKKGAPYGSCTPEEATRRNKLATLSASCEAVQVMTGQIQNADTLADFILAVQEKLYKKLFG